MKDYLNIINDLYPKRRKKEEKEQLYKYVKEEANIHGYEVKKEVLKEKHQNIVIGDINNAKVIFTAHYDTPATSLFPNLMMPRNIILGYIYHIGYPLIMAVISLLISYYLWYWLDLDYGVYVCIYIVLYFGMFFLSTRCFTNKYNKNDNTSGVATILSLIERNPNNSNIAFILFDNEEKGLLGSKAYNKEYKELLENKLIVNMDCVGNGNHILYIVSKNAEQLNEYLIFKESLINNDSYQNHIYSTKGSMGNSDHKSFKNSIGVMACNQNKFIGFYAGRIHTNRDVVAKTENIEFICDNMDRFISKIK